MGYMMHNVDRSTPYPKLSEIPGKEPCLICFRSSFPPPYNICQFSSCIGNQRRRRESNCDRTLALQTRGILAAHR
jgi:hypothetical protein